jgi:hypothetical protein
MTVGLFNSKLTNKDPPKLDMMPAGLQWQYLNERHTFVQKGKVIDVKRARERGRTVPSLHDG